MYTDEIGESVCAPDNGCVHTWVRRSVRKTARMLKAERQQYLEECLADEHIENNLNVCEHPVKGRCVLAGKILMKNEFVAEYKGDLIEVKEARLREMTYSTNPGFGCYMFYFQYQDKNYCVDASAETEFKGRLINHSRTKANLTAQVVRTSCLHIVLNANRDIEEGEELLFDYGDRSNEALKAFPWLRD